MIAVHGLSMGDPGCGSANVAVGLARLGVPVALVGPAPDDPRMLDRMEAEGVENRVSRRLSADVAAIHTCLDPSPDPSEDVEELLRRERGRILVSLDPNVEPGTIGARSTRLGRLEEWLGTASLVRVGRADLGGLVPDEPPESVVERWAASRATLVVLTLGADGAYAVGPGGSARSGAHPVDVVDTVGAGDAFTAGVLAWLHRRGLCEPRAVGHLSEADLADLLGFASRVAALTCRRAGAEPPTLAEVEAGP